MAVCTNFVLINKILCGYGTMFLEYEEFFAKKSKAVSHFRAMGDQTHLYIFQYDKLLSKAYVKTAHAVCESTKLFLTWSDFTILSIIKLVILARDHIVFNLSLQTKYQFADTNIIK